MLSDRFCFDLKIDSQSFELPVDHLDSNTNRISLHHILQQKINPSFRVSCFTHLEDFIKTFSFPSLTIPQQIEFR